MSDVEIPRPKGLNIHNKAPLINTVDINMNLVHLTNLLEKYNGVMLDFFRGNW